MERDRDRLSRRLFASLSFAYRTSFMTTETCLVFRTVTGHGYKHLLNVCWDNTQRNTTSDAVLLWLFTACRL